MEDQRRVFALMQPDTPSSIQPLPDLRPRYLFQSILLVVFFDLNVFHHLVPLLQPAFQAQSLEDLFATVEFHPLVRVEQASDVVHSEHVHEFWEWLFLGQLELDVDLTHCALLLFLCHSYWMDQTLKIDELFGQVQPVTHEWSHISRIFLDGYLCDFALLDLLRLQKFGIKFSPLPHELHFLLFVQMIHVASQKPAVLLLEVIASEDASDVVDHPLAVVPHETVLNTWQLQVVFRRWFGKLSSSAVERRNIEPGDRLVDLELYSQFGPDISGQVDVDVNEQRDDGPGWIGEDVELIGIKYQQRCRNSEHSQSDTRQEVVHLGRKAEFIYAPPPLIDEFVAGQGVRSPSYASPLESIDSDLYELVDIDGCGSVHDCGADTDYHQLDGYGDGEIDQVDSKFLQVPGVHS